MYAQERLIQEWDDIIVRWRTIVQLDDLEIDLEKNSKFYSLSYDIQFCLDSLFFKLVSGSRADFGHYCYISEGIFPYKAYNQTREYKSSTHCSEILFGTRGDSFYIQTTIPNVECVWSQQDEWWKCLADLCENHNFYFDMGDSRKKTNKRNISNFIQKLVSYTHEKDGDEFGHFLVTWGNIFDSKASLKEGINIFKLLHKINHGLYRTNYLRSKSKHS